MKYSPRFSYTFTPSSNTLNLSANTNFNIAGLLAVIDTTNSVLIYAVATTGLGYSGLSGGNILTLQFNCSSLSSSDVLTFIYDDGLPTSAATTRSTASISTDVASVTMPHPLGVQYIQGVQSTNLTGTITSSSSIVGPLTVTSFNVITVGVYGTFTGVSFTFQASPDGTNWFTVQGSRVDNGLVSTGSTSLSSSLLAWDIPIGAWSQFRVQATAWASGTANIFMGAQTLPYDPAPATIPQGLSAVGTAIPSVNPLLIAGSDGTNTRLFSTVLKGTQGAYALATQDLRDSGRNQTNYYMTIPVITTATDTLQSLTGFKSNAAVAATTTPVVVTTGKTYRVTGISIVYVATTTIGTAKFTLRANTAGVVAIGSSAVQSWVIGTGSATAGATSNFQIDAIDGMEFAAGTGIGVSMYGLGSTQAAAATGYGMISISGFEY